MKINQIIPSLIKVSDKLSTTKDFEVVAYIDSIIRKLVEATKFEISPAELNNEDLKYANDFDKPMIREAAAVTLIQVSDSLDNVNTKLADRVDAAIKLLAQNKCSCECNKCTLCKESSNTTKHCCRKNRGCSF